MYIPKDGNGLGVFVSSLCTATAAEGPLICGGYSLAFCTTSQISAVFASLQPIALSIASSA